jgi:fluoride exporter
VTSEPDPAPVPPVDPDVGARRPPALRASDLLAVLLGGILGTVARYGTASALPTGHDAWPTATFVVNLVASFVLGFVVAALARRGPDTGGRLTARLVLGTGVCGALSTYSTFAVETVLLVRDDRPGLATAYASVTVAGGLLLAWLGLLVARAVPARRAA